MAYPDPVDLVKTWLATNLAVTEVQWETNPNLPAARPNLAYSLPLVHLARVAAPGSTWLTLNKPKLDIVAYAATHTAAADLAGDIHTAMLFDLPGHTTTGGAFVRAVACDVDPVSIPYDNRAISRVGATYRLVIHFDPTSGS